MTAPDVKAQVKETLDILRYDEQKAFKRSFELIKIFGEDPDFAEEFIENEGLSVLVNLLKTTKGAAQGYVLAALRALLLYVNAIEEVVQSPDLVERLYLLLGATEQGQKVNLNVAKQTLEIFIVLIGMLEIGHKLVHKAAKHKRADSQPYQYVANLLVCPDLLVVRNSLTFLNMLLTKRKDISEKKWKKLVFILKEAGVLNKAKELVTVEDDSIKKQLTLFQKLAGVTIPLSFFEAEQWKSRFEEMKKQFETVSESLFVLQQQQPKIRLMKLELQKAQETVQALAAMYKVSPNFHPTKRAEGNIDFGGLQTESVPDITESPAMKSLRDLLFEKIVSSDEYKGKVAKMAGLTGGGRKAGSKIVDVFDGLDDDEEFDVPPPRRKGKVIDDDDDDGPPPDSDDEPPPDDDDLPPDEDEPPPDESDDDVGPPDPSGKPRAPKPPKPNKGKGPGKGGKAGSGAGGSAPGGGGGEGGESQVQGDHPASATGGPGIGAASKENPSAGVAQLTAGGQPITQEGTVPAGTDNTTALPQTPGSPTAAGGGPPPPPPPRPPGGPPPPGPPPPPGVGVPVPAPAPGAWGAAPTWGAPAAAAGPAAVYYKGTAPTKKMRPFHWDKFKIESEKAFWNRIHNGDIDCGYDYEEFENMFSQKEVEKKEKKEVVVKIQLMDAKKFQNISIMLHKMPKIPQIQRAVFDLDDSLIAKDSLEAMIAQVPSMEESKEFNANKDKKPVEEYEPPEQFFAMILGTTEFQKRCQAWLFTRDWADNMANIMKPIDRLRVAVAAVRGSKHLPYIMGVILGFGNMMNYGNNLKGNAPGFHFNTLNKLDASKDKSGKISMFQYLITTIQHHHPEALEFGDEVSAVLNNITTIKSEDIEKSVKDATDALNRFRQQVKTVKEKLEKEGASRDDIFIVRMTAFYVQAEEQLKTLTEIQTQLRDNFIDILEWWSCPAKMLKEPKPEEFFNEFVPFVVKFKALTAEYFKEKKKREKKKGETLAAGKGKPADGSDVMTAIVNSLSEKLVTG
eukprot:PhF_6_TR16999/c0_g2_i1/m.25732/K02184/FMN2; formin 2